jgi:hypothetical protein
MKLAHYLNPRFTVYSTGLVFPRNNAIQYNYFVYKVEQQSQAFYKRNKYYVKLFSPLHLEYLNCYVHLICLEKNYVLVLKFFVIHWITVNLKNKAVGPIERNHHDKRIRFGINVSGYASV